MNNNFVKPSKSFIRMVCLFAVLSSAFQKDVLAKDNMPDDMLLAANRYAGQEIIVTANRVEELKKEATASVTVISREEIEMSPAEDLGELFAEKSIGHIQKYPGALTSVGIRGFRSDTHGNDLRGKILVLIDGRRAATGNLAKLMTANVERIEIIRGPAAVQYGSAAIGGVVNVITRKGEGEIGGFVEQEIGSYSFSKTTAGFSGKSGGLDYSVAASLASRDDYKTGANDRYFNTAYDDDFRGSVNLGYEFTPGHRLGVTYTHFDVEKAGTPYYLVDNDLDDYKESSNRSIDFSYTGKTSDDRFSWMARYVIGQDKDSTYDPVASNTGWGSDDGVPYIKITDQDAAQAQVSYLTDALSVTAGVDWLNYDLEQNAYTPRESAYENTGFFVLAKGRLFDERLVLTAGSRYDDYDVSYTRTLTAPETSQSSDSFVKSFGLAYQLTDNVKLRTSYGEGFLMPDAQSLAADFEAGSQHYVGNPDLKPESSYTIDGGIEVVYGDLMSSLTLFTTDYKDFIQQYDSAPNEKSWRNQDSATVTGLEAEISYRFPLTVAGASLSLEPYAAGTYMFDYVAHYDDGSPDETIQYLPEWNLSTGLKVRDDNGFSGNFNFTFFGDTEVTDWTIGGVDVTKGGFWVANLSVAKKISLGETGKTSLTVKGGIENLFDRNYEYVIGYPMPGRAANMGVSLDF